MRVALLLAGGEGRRFGRRDKLLEMIGGAPLLLQTLRMAQSAGQRTILILPPGFARRRALVAGRRGLAIRTARDARQGIDASLAAGLKALRPIDREVIVFLADMPFATPLRLQLCAGQDAVRPMWLGQPGHPMLVRASAVRGLAIPSDKGLSAILDRKRIALVKGDEGHTLDIDTPAALRRLRYRIALRERRCSPRPPNISRPPRR